MNVHGFTQVHVGYYALLVTGALGLRPSTPGWPKPQARPPLHKGRSRARYMYMCMYMRMYMYM